MLSKSIKHEFRATSRVMLPLMLALLALSVVTHFAPMILTSGNAHWVFQLLVVLVLIAFSVGLIVVSVGAIAVTAIRFHRSFFSDEGYLNMTLPVSIHTHIASRLIVSFIWYFFAAVAIILSVMVAFMDGQTWLSFFGAFGQLVQQVFQALQSMGSRGVWHVILASLELLSSMILAQVFGSLLLYAAIAMGYSFNKHKKGMAFLCGIGLYLLTQFAATIAIYAAGASFLFDVQTEDPYAAVGVMEALMGYGIFLELLGCAAFYTITYLFMRKKLNLE